MREQQKGLYRPAFEHDNCGIGAVVNSRGIRSHLTVERALHIVENLEHRAGKDAEGSRGPSRDFAVLYFEIGEEDHAETQKRDGAL